MHKVTAPVKGYCGAGYGMVFENGIGYTDNKTVVDQLRQMGYVVENAQKQKPGNEPSAQPSTPDKNKEPN